MKKIFALLFICAMTLSFTCCKPLTLPEEMPEDFTFYVQWGPFGFSAYSSQTGRLIKTLDTGDPSKYMTTYYMPLGDLRKVYSMIREMGIENYPEVIPEKDLQGSDPYATYTVSATVNGKTYTVTAKAASGYDAGKSIEAQKFLSTVKRITELLESSSAWKDLPEDNSVKVQ